MWQTGCPLAMEHGHKTCYYIHYKGDGDRLWAVKGLHASPIGTVEDIEEGDHWRSGETWEFFNYNGVNLWDGGDQFYQAILI